MTSVVSIANTALIKMGIDSPLIVDIDENSNSARVMKQLYEPSKKSVLRRNIWRFSLKRARLAPLVTGPEFGDGNYFSIPTDCLRIIGTSIDQFYDYLPWKREGDKILADTDTLDIVYVSDVTDPSKFDPIFTEMLSAYMGYNACNALVRDAGVKQGLFDEFRQLASQAAYVSATERDSSKIIAETFLRAR